MHVLLDTLYSQQACGSRRVAALDFPAVLEEHVDAQLRHVVHADTAKARQKLTDPALDVVSPPQQVRVVQEQGWYPLFSEVSVSQNEAVVHERLLEVRAVPWDAMLVDSLRNAFGACAPRDRKQGGRHIMSKTGCNFRTPASRITLGRAALREARVGVLSLHPMPGVLVEEHGLGEVPKGAVDPQPLRAIVLGAALGHGPTALVLPHTGAALRRHHPAAHQDSLQCGAAMEARDER
eukprot:CAMPEP_0179129980 /NCGR_PEP_ID=MMETSP0796-20121207/61691_1 /TAXON_ID=73915 /ORGANISM="Pyrodinium bahamense, Strain pbaha01" /LENGTH=235 /DNA_ID=CAMNT_0020828871 /DNA_START=169 /DNA_END=877 /DNA_ORIENTATION=-